MMALVGAVLAIAGTQVSAKAATISLGDITNSSDTQFGGKPGPISDDITFSLTTLSNVSFTVSNLQVLPNFDIAGFLATTSDFTLTAGPGSFTFAGVLAAGNYLIHATGTGIGLIGGLYQIDVTAAATPIPGALLLFVTAIGGMAGFAGFRRRGSAEA
jgi:hypothetical protein